MNRFFRYLSRLFGNSPMVGKTPNATFGAYPHAEEHPTKKPEVLYHPNGIPVGMLPGDPVPEQNLAAIFDFVERHGQPIAQTIQPGEAVNVHLEAQNES